MAFFDFFKRKPAEPARPARPVAAPAPKPVAPPAPARPAPAPAPPPAVHAAAHDDAHDDLHADAPFVPTDTDHDREVEAALLNMPLDHDGPERRERNRRNARAGTRVLVVDDSATIVALLRRMLQQNGYEVLEAFDAESALAIAKKEPLELIFLDIVLPGMDGFSALRALRRNPATKDVPIIMISGNAQATEQFYVRRIGADDFLKKPFTRAEVFTRVEILLDEELVPRRAKKEGA